jgi:hypothetical protein
MFDLNHIENKKIELVNVTQTRDVTASWASESWPPLELQHRFFIFFLLANQNKNQASKNKQQTK